MRTEYVQRARNSAISTYAILKGGEWFAKGEMGWFGCSNDTLTQVEWDKKFDELISSLDGDTLVSVYDCHI